MSTSRRGDLPKNQKDLRATTAERLEAIVEAAERAAESVIDDAEAQARRYLAQAQADADRAGDRRLADLSVTIDALLGQAASLRREAERMQAVLEEAKLRIDPEGSPAPVEEAPEPEGLSSVEAGPRLRAVPGAEEAAPEPKLADAAGARLLATQMAVSGSSREEIESRLRNRFEIEDTSPILDAILGPED
ncbi:MAG TPA: hypothetical protein VFP17_12725 [Solirubrobacterales bacterium]|nr:hypothetical protein [Solirubrobacterales bacterium]